MRVVLALMIASTAIAGDWHKLFDGKTLKGCGRPMTALP